MSQKFICGLQSLVEKADETILELSEFRGVDTGLSGKKLELEIGFLEKQRAELKTQIHDEMTKEILAAYKSGPELEGIAVEQHVDSLAPRAVEDIYKAIVQLDQVDGDSLESLESALKIIVDEGKSSGKADHSIAVANRILSDTEFTAKSKLRLSVPFIPGIVSWITEFELGNKPSVKEALAKVKNWFFDK